MVNYITRSYFQMEFFRVSSRSTYCPPSTPLGDSDSEKVKAKRICEASQVEVGDQVAEERRPLGAIISSPSLQLIFITVSAITSI